MYVFFIISNNIAENFFKIFRKFSARLIIKFNFLYFYGLSKPEFHQQNSIFF